jgi:hypothetical protein
MPEPCTRCGCPVPLDSEDDAYCPACIQATDQMARARGACALFQAREYANRPDLAMFAFLRIFHPAMPVAMAARLARDP